MSKPSRLKKAISRPTEKSSEEWKTIFGFEAYQASNQGRIRRAVGGKGTRAGYVLKPKPHKAGYSVVDLSVKNVVTRMTIARAVALAFHGKPPTRKHQAAHWDGDPTRDVQGNVRWATPKENSDDADRHGRRRRGQRHQNSKLTEYDVRCLRKLRSKKMTFKALGKMFGVSTSNAFEACSGKRQWSHV